MGAIGVVLLTSAAGAGAAFCLSNFLISWQQIPNREGAAGYFALYLTVFGLIGGFIVGLIAALTVRSGFLRAQGFALAAVLVLTVISGVLAIVLDDEGPMIEGSKLEVEVEVRYPRGVDPSATAKSEQGNFCWIQEQAADGPLDKNPIVLGEFTIGDTLVRCVVPLTKSWKNRYLRVFFGNAADVNIRVPLAAKPTRRDLDWSNWTNQREYSFRLRVRKSGAATHGGEPAL